MAVTLVVFTDGRDYIYETVPSALAMLDGPITRRIIYDDSGDALNRDRLAAAFPTFTITHCPEGRQGFGGAIRFMWKYLASLDENEFVFHLEDDFVFNRWVNVAAMADLLRDLSAIQQVALRRQPWSQEEHEAGGVVERHPERFASCESHGYPFLWHREFFTTNPCLYRRSLCRRGWPDDPQSEGKLGALLRMEADNPPFAYWGSRDDEPWVTHIGRERVGSGY